MQNIGEALRTARESRGLSLDQAEDDTKIRKRYLQALEDGDYDVIPGAVYAKGFLKNYAGYLGLNQEEIMIKFKLATAPPREEGPREDIRETINRRRASRRSNKRAYMAAAIVALLAMGTFALYGLIAEDAKDSPVTAQNNAAVGQPKGDPKKQPPKKQDAQKQDTQEQDPIKQAAVNGVNGQNPANPANPAGGADNGPDTEVTIPAADQVTVVLKGQQESCWARVLVDGRVVFTGQINPGDIKTFNGDKVTFRLGNAGAVDVSVNGQQLGLLGPKGKVVDKEYSSQAPNNG